MSDKEWNSACIDCIVSSSPCECNVCLLVGWYLRSRLSSSVMRRLSLAEGRRRWFVFLWLGSCCLGLGGGGRGLADCRLLFAIRGTGRTIKDGHYTIDNIY